MKSRPVKVTIPSPCSENWNAMENQNGQKFCLSCQKTVVDFTTSSNADIVKALMNANGNPVCGRVLNRQLKSLNYYLIPVTNPWNWRKHFGVLAIGTLFLMGSCTKSAPEKDAPIHKIYGYVIDEEKKPVIGIQVRIDGTSFVGITDRNGRYEISSRQEFDARHNRLATEREGFKDFFNLDYTKDLQDTIKMEEMIYATAGLILIEPVADK